MKGLKYIFIIVDTGFILYWLSTALHLIPKEYLYKDYNNQIMIDWNWSFLPLDLFISFTGYLSIYYEKKQKETWTQWAFSSLILTFVSGLQALSFWAIRMDFDITWWLFNGFLLFYPMFYIPRFLKKKLD